MPRSANQPAGMANSQSMRLMSASPNGEPWPRIVAGFNARAAGQVAGPKLGPTRQATRYSQIKYEFGKGITCFANVGGSQTAKIFPALTEPIADPIFFIVCP